MWTFLAYCAVFWGGYVASIYSWPWVRTQAIGAAAEATKLRQRARDLENKIKGVF